MKHKITTVREGSRKNMEKAKRLLRLFLTFLKIGAFTFGGGYAMIALLEREIVAKKQWLTNDEFLDMTGIAEATPGPVAINSATYVGYKIGGVLGALLATLGVVLPSFSIIFIISLFFDAFLSLTVVTWAFRGIRAGVTVLILSAGIRLFARMEKTPLALVIFGAVFLAMLAISLFVLHFSSVFLLLFSGVIGLCAYAIRAIRKGDKS